MFHKYLPSFLGFCLTASVSGYDSRVTYHTPEEIQGFGDFNGDTFLDVVTVDRATGQFEIDDKRPVSDISHLLQQQGFDPVWKDWDSAILTP